MNHKIYTLVGLVSSYTKSPIVYIRSTSTAEIMETYLRLTTEDKKRLIDIAKKKQLSVSTATAIIIKHYWVFIWSKNEYYKKGENLVHIKIRNKEKLDINTIKATNCVYSYLHHEELPQANWKNVDRKIQSEMDKTYDPNANKNLEMRIAYRVKKGNL